MPFADLETQSLVDFIAEIKGDDQTLWLFQHIPKTAGSSFSTELRHQRGPYCNIHIDYSDTETSPADAIEAATLRFLTLAATGAYRSASGHLPSNLVRRIRAALPQTRTVTFLREPQARVISDYRYQRTPAHPPYKECIERYPTIESFVAAPENQNIMAKYILGHEASDMLPEDIRVNAGRFHDFIGLLEMYPMSFNIFFRLVGINGMLPKEHERKTVATDVNKVEASAELAEMIRHYNPKDFVLYDHVRNVLLSHREAFWSAPPVAD